MRKCSFIALGALLYGIGGSALALQPPSTAGLADSEGVETVAQHCTICHSSALITQNRASREGWLTMIRWMQEKQGLWPLGDAEAVILDYLEANYSPEFRGRRAPLDPDLMPSGPS